MVHSRFEGNLSIAPSDPEIFVEGVITSDSLHILKSKACVMSVVITDIY